MVTSKTIRQTISTSFDCNFWMPILWNFQTLANLTQNQLSICFSKGKETRKRFPLIPVWSHLQPKDLKRMFLACEKYIKRDGRGSKASGKREVEKHSLSPKLNRLVQVIFALTSSFPCTDSENERGRRWGKISYFFLHDSEVESLSCQSDLRLGGSELEEGRKGSTSKCWAPRMLQSNTLVLLSPIR